MKARMFNQNVVRYIMNGTQSQDRRPLKDQPQGELVCQQDTLGYPASEGFRWYGFGNPKDPVFYKPRHEVGDIIGVRERVRLVEMSESQIFNDRYYGTFKYEADGFTTGAKIPDRLKPLVQGHCCPNGCFKELIRTFLKVTAVRLERIQDTTDLDALSEGIQWDDACPEGVSNGYYPGAYDRPSEAFKYLWNSIYPGSWESNDWVEVTKFELAEKLCKM